MLKILDSFGERPQNVGRYIEQIRRCNDENYKFDCINHREKLGISRAWSPIELDNLYRQKDRQLLRFYQEIFELCKNYDVFIVNHENVYHPEFVKKLSQITYTVLYTGDDPESSYFCSQPYVWAFDHVLCYAVYYDENTRMTDKLKEWGTKRATLKPYGYEWYTHKESISEEELFAKERDIDIIYVGGAYNKVERLLKIKKAFGKRFHLYGNWGGIKGFLSRFKRYQQFLWVSPLSQEQFVSLYQQAKIGINMHISYGPSNLRMWQLPINGVMQITDNPKGTAEFFEIGKEIVCYENDNIDDAIDKIRYYLDHDEKRIKIARAGYHKVLKKFSFEQTYRDAMEEIKKGLLEKKLNGV